VPLLCTVPGISWVLAYTIAAELGEFTRFPSPRKLAGSAASARASTNRASATCAARSPSKPPLPALGARRGRHPPCTHPAYRHRYQQLKTRVGKQRGAKVAQVDLARRLSEAIWHMLTRDQPFAPAGATDPLSA
jgi:transposase